MKNLYDTLGVARNASKEEIKRAYRNKAKQCHSDVGGTDEAMAELTFAYSVLKDEAKRKQYDETGACEGTAFDSFEEKARSVFVKLVYLLLIENDVSDIMEQVNRRIKHAEELTKSEVQQLQHKKARLEKAQKRILKAPEYNLIAAIIGAELDSIVAKLLSEQEDLKLNKRVKEMFDEYQFKKEENKVQTTHIRIV